jgi:lysophospholipase L1-like esterase
MRKEFIRVTSLTVALAGLALLVSGAGVALDAQQQTPTGPRWRIAWATSQQALGSTALSNTTVRLIARTTIGGDAVRIRIDNTYGTDPLRIGKAYVGIRTRGAALAAGSNRPVLVGGKETFTVAPGGTVRSDPVQLKVLARQDLAVSLYVPGDKVQMSQHSGAVVTSYLGAPGGGDRAAVESNEPFSGTTTAMPWLKAIDVRSSSAGGSIVAFGDSITDGTCTTVDANERWEDWVSIRLGLEDDRLGGRNAQKAIVNEGIGGNTLTREGLQPPPDSAPAVERIDRDVLSHEGVTDVIVFIGTNDIRRGASAPQVIAALSQISARVKAKGAKVFGVTIIPRHNVAATGSNTGWDEAKTAIRREVNQWIRSRAPFDGVLDFDAVVRDPSNADLIFAPFNCDGIHPNPRGYYELGKSVSLPLFMR